MQSTSSILLRAHTHTHTHTHTLPHSLTCSFMAQVCILNIFHQALQHRKGERQVQDSSTLPPSLPPSLIHSLTPMFPMPIISKHHNYKAIENTNHNSLKKNRRKQLRSSGFSSTSSHLGLAFNNNQLTQLSESQYLTTCDTWITPKATYSMPYKRLIKNKNHCTSW